MPTDTDLRPPSWLTKAEKSTFRHVIAAREKGDRPVLAVERDLVADYAAVRQRIVRLRRIEAESIFPRDKLAAAAAVSAATKLARQLGRDLRLGFEAG